MTTEQIVTRSKFLWHSVKVVSDIYYQMQDSLFNDPSEDTREMLSAVKGYLDKVTKEANEFYEKEWKEV